MIKPILKKIMVRKCVTGIEEEHEGRTYHRVGGIVITDARADYQHWCEILDVSDDCKLFDKSHIGKFVWLPEFKPNHMYRIGSSDDLVVRESLFTEKHGAPAMVVGD